MIALNAIKVLFSPGTATEKVALHALSLDIQEGEFVTVIGSNGAGKSTLLNIISGETLPQSGDVVIDGHTVTSLRTHERSHAVARVFQDPLAGTCGDLTVAENLALAQKRGLSRLFRLALTAQKKAHFKELLKSLNLGLETRLNTMISLLSGGQRQAVSLLMATQSPLKILLLDEHTAALDPKTAESVMNITNELVQTKKLTTLMVTHSLHQALDFGTRTIMLHEGKIIYDVRGEERKSLTPQDLLKRFSLDDDRLLFQ